MQAFEKNPTLFNCLLPQDVWNSQVTRNPQLQYMKKWISCLFLTSFIVSWMSHPKSLLVTVHHLWQETLPSAFETLRRCRGATWRSPTMNHQRLAVIRLNPFQRNLVIYNSNDESEIGTWSTVYQSTNGSGLVDSQISSNIYRK